MGDYSCSICGSVYSGGDRFRYCPNCAAKMYEDCASNADQIRSMSNEELAKFLTPKGCPPVFSNCPATTCRQCWLNWLQMPEEVHK